MDLTFGAPFWPLKNGLLNVYARLDQDIETDVCILGAGITGALVCDAFSEAGIDTVVIDKREVGYGSTAVTTGLLQYELDTMLVELAKQIGQDHAVRAYTLCADAVTELINVIDELPEACGMHRRPSLFLGAAKKDVKLFKAECEARRSAGIDVEYLSSDEVFDRFKFRRPCALWSKEAGEVDAFRLTHQILQRSIGRAARVYDRTEIKSIKIYDDHVVLSTVSGRRITAKRVVFATGYETPDFMDQKLVQLRSTFAAFSEPVPHFDGWPERCLIWEHADPYLYVRTTSDNRVLVGGEDARFHTLRRHDDLVCPRTKRLMKRFVELFPDIPFSLDWASGGVFGQTKDGLPYIGTNKQFPLGYFALGYGGNGILFSFIASRLLRDLHLRKKRRELELFSFQR